jgi:mRNA-degrading endonuclease RelE of RelBE toxin-antitoxin system
VRLRFHPGVQDAIRTLAPATKKAVREALRLLEVDPRHPSLDWKVLRTKGADVFLRVRVGDYRIICLLRPDAVYVDRVMHRSEGYGWLERA